MSLSETFLASGLLGVSQYSQKPCRMLPLNNQLVAISHLLHHRVTCLSLILSLSFPCFLYSHCTIVIDISQPQTPAKILFIQSCCKSFDSKGLRLARPAPGDVSPYAARGYVRDGACSINPTALPRFSSLHRMGRLYCAAFIPSRRTLGFHFCDRERLCIVWFFLYIGRPQTPCRIFYCPRLDSANIRERSSVEALEPFIYQPYFSPPLQACGRDWIYLSAMTPRS